MRESPSSFDDLVATGLGNAVEQERHERRPTCCRAGLSADQLSAKAGRPAGRWRRRRPPVGIHGADALHGDAGADVIDGG